MSFQKNREMMIENQLRPNKITDNKIIEVINNLPKENFISQDKINVCYSDQDIPVLDVRGYLKNLHIAQILHFAEIKSNEKVLHIGGLTGYISILIARLCNEIYVIENNENCLKEINKNLEESKVKNAFVYKKNLSSGLLENKPYDLIIIDCPQFNINHDLLDQINMGGRIIYIEKINDELSKAYKMTKFENNYSKDFLFDVFSSFYLIKKEEVFNF